LRWSWSDGASTSRLQTAHAKPHPVGDARQRPRQPRSADGQDQEDRVTGALFVIVSILAVVTLRQDFAGAAGGDPGSFVTAGRSPVAVHDWMFLLGPGFVAGVGNGLILGWLMYRSGLVPPGAGQTWPGPRLRDGTGRVQV
jgi:hypothetical protein